MNEAEAASQVDSKKVPKEQLEGSSIVAASYLIGKTKIEDLIHSKFEGIIFNIKFLLNEIFKEQDSSKFTGRLNKGEIRQRIDLDKEETRQRGLYKGDKTPSKK